MIIICFTSQCGTVLAKGPCFLFDDVIFKTGETTCVFNRPFFGGPRKNIEKPSSTTSSSIQKTLPPGADDLTLWAVETSTEMDQIIEMSV